jgi:hypothetical protein
MAVLKEMCEEYLRDVLCCGTTSENLPARQSCGVQVYLMTGLSSSTTSR